MNEQSTHSTSEARESEPPAQIRAWMDRLTVEHEYDPSTGFIVAREVVSLPPAVTGGPGLRETVARGQADGLPVIVFATADRCAPCQQFKRDALNAPKVIARLNEPDVIATHVEVDRQAEEAESVLGSLGIPVTYLIRDGEVTDTLPGQRSAAELHAWLDRALAATE